MRVIEEVQTSDQLVALLQQDSSQPILLRENDRDAAVLLSPELYEEYLNSEFTRICAKIGEEAKANGLTEEILNEILAEAKAERSR